jgi:hypothetical protein
VELDDEGLAVEAWFPCPDDNTQPTVAGAGASKPQFERTVSGKITFVNVSESTNYSGPCTK